MTKKGDVNIKNITTKIIRISNLLALLGMAISLGFMIATKVHKWIDITIWFLLISEQSQNILLQDKLEKTTSSAK